MKVKKPKSTRVDNNRVVDNNTNSHKSGCSKASVSVNKKLKGNSQQPVHKLANISSKILSIAMVVLRTFVKFLPCHV